MKLSLVTVGTRGDAQPFIVLGRVLAARGFDVTIATHTDYEAWVRESGLGFAPIGGSFKQLMESPEGREWIESADSLRRYAETTRKTFVPLLEIWMRDMIAAGEEADALVVHPYAVPSAYIAEKRGIPALFTSLIPWIPASRFAESIFFPRVPKIGPLRRWLTELAARSVWDIAIDLHQDARDELGLPRFTSKNPWNEILGPRFPVLNPWSEALIPRPLDWPDWVHVTGFIFDDAPDDYEPPADLAQFLTRGPAPIYIGFGSMTGRDPVALARLAAAAVEQTGQRALLATGWGGMEAGELPDSIFPLGPVPHAWLFPRVAGVVHHGGAGTTAAGLRAGRPTLVTAFFGDQPFFGHRVKRVSAGPAPILRKNLDAKRLARGIDDLLSTERYRTNAAEIGRTLQEEKGGERAAGVIERHLTG